jgi:uncharacterized protein (DUF1330 family)
MKTAFTVAVSMLAGIAIGTAITGLNAQTRAPGAYVVIDISELTDANAFRQQLLPKVTPESLSAFGGRYMIRSEQFTVTDGTPPARLVVIAFDSMDKAKAWEAAPNQQEVTAIRKRVTKSRQFFAEAFSN